MDDRRAGVSSYLDNNVVNGTKYFYQVSALNNIGESTRSNETSATSTAATTAPSPPSLSGSAGNTSATLSWTTPADGGNAITGYRIYRGTSSATETLLTSVGLVNGYTDTTVANGGSYYYQVSAVNGVGDSVRSNELLERPATTPSTPALTTSAGNATVTLQWTTPANGGSAITGYRIYRGSSAGTETLFTSVGAVNVYTDTAVSNGGTYYYQVTALNSVGEGSRSNETIARPATTPSAPSLSATAGTMSVHSRGTRRRTAARPLAVTASSGRRAPAPKRCWWASARRRATPTRRSSVARRTSTKSLP